MALILMVIAHDSDDVYTDAFGQYTLDYLSPGSYTVMAEKGGFTRGMKVEVAVTSGGQTDTDMVMQSGAVAAKVSGSITNYLEVAPKDENGVLLPYPFESDYDEIGYLRTALAAFPSVADFLDHDYIALEPYGMSIPDDGYEDFFETSTTETPGYYSMTLPASNVDISPFSMTEDTDGWYVIIHDWHSLQLNGGENITGYNFTAQTNFGTLTGDLFVPAGKSLKSKKTTILVFNENDDSSNKFDGFARPGFGTSYTFAKIPAGTYTIRAISEGLAPHVIPGVVVYEGITTTQDISFAAGGTLTGTITDGSAAVEGAKVKVRQTGNFTHTDASGAYTITGIGNGTYNIDVSISGYAPGTAEATFTATTTTITLDFTLSTQVGSISGSVTDSDGGGSVNNATVVAYNTGDGSYLTTTTVAGAYDISELIYGDYVVAVNAEGYAVATYPSMVTINSTSPVSGIDFSLTGIAPEFSVSSSISEENLSMTFYSDIPLDGDPSITVVSGSGVLGTVIAISSVQWQVVFTADTDNTIVQINIEGTGSGMTGNETFSFEVTSTSPQETATTNVTNAAGGETTMMGTQDNTKVYVPPFALAGTDDTTAVALTIERYGDPGDPVEGTSDTPATSVYDFSFGDEGVTVAENHTLTVTMSFQLPDGMTQQEFVDTFEVRYFNVNLQQWTTEGISEVNINWNNYTITLKVSHLSKFAAFVPDGGCNPDETQPCNTGLEGICAAGIQTCDGTGQWGECIQVNQPSEEICDGLDNNCENGVDETDDALCDNGQWCDGAETCDGANRCLAGTAPSCNDNVDCTDDSCNEITDRCVNTANNDNCDNGQWCDGAETCDQVEDCQAGTPPDCNDNADCTDDSCDELNSRCANNPNDAHCDDSNVCTNDSCVDGQCENTTASCDDGDACTEDSCDPDTGCFNEPVDNCDYDGDGINDSYDNCPELANADQFDCDGDGIGNACDDESYCQSICGRGTVEFILELQESDSTDIPMDSSHVSLSFTTNSGQNYILPAKAFGTQINLGLLKAHNWNKEVNLCLDFRLFPFSATVSKVGFKHP